jgi:hypothetical protein
MRKWFHMLLLCSWIGRMMMDKLIVSRPGLMMMCTVMCVCVYVCVFLCVCVCVCVFRISSSSSSSSSSFLSLPSCSSVVVDCRLRSPRTPTPPYPPAPPICTIGGTLHLRDKKTKELRVLQDHRATGWGGGEEQRAGGRGRCTNS